ncbi:unnamed protein product [Cyprideis torosa]|uniref:Uncharacterized protein n=1 Tax=Cyprideis torosa TaxID=163714 RepID=A0A7R8ZSL0_9CRUS|nr:unnamed protein product [Cyprideis torosa]CAG0896304.1 unnamed protein product [Cyprideis torosa]
MKNLILLLGMTVCCLAATERCCSGETNTNRHGYYGWRHGHRRPRGPRKGSSCFPQLVELAMDIFGVSLDDVREQFDESTILTATQKQTGDDFVDAVEDYGEELKDNFRSLTTSVRSFTEETLNQAESDLRNLTNILRDGGFSRSASSRAAQGKTNLKFNEKEQNRHRQGVSSQEIREFLQLTVNFASALDRLTRQILDGLAEVDKSISEIESTETQAGFRTRIDEALFNDGVFELLEEIFDELDRYVTATGSSASRAMDEIRDSQNKIAGKLSDMEAIVSDLVGEVTPETTTMDPTATSTPSSGTPSTSTPSSGTPPS